MHRGILVTSLLLASLSAAPVEARQGEQGPRWDRYQHYDFRDRHGHAPPARQWGHHHHYYPPHVIEHHHYYGYRDRHGHRGHHRRHHHSHEIYTIIGGAILLNEILHH